VDNDIARVLLLFLLLLLLLLLYADVDADVVVDCSGCLLDADEDVDADVADGVEAGVTSPLIGFDIVASQRCTSSVGQANR